MKTYKDLKDFLLDIDSLSQDIGEEKCLEILEDFLLTASNKIYCNHARNWDNEKNKFQKEILPIAHQSTFCRHVYLKPKGYPGDYISQEMIWLGRTRGGRWRYDGTSNIGQLINSFTLNMANPRANEERIYILQDIIKNSGKRIASIGCGSCIEFWNIDEITDKKIDLFLLDQDLDALHNALKHLAHHRNLKISAKKANIIKYLIGNKDELGKRDLIYLSGFVSYFSVNSAKKIIKKLWQHVASDGKLVFTNAHPDNPTRLWMEFIGEWFLEYKDKQMMIKIAQDLDKIKDMDYRIDRYGVYQYLVIHHE